MSKEIKSPFPVAYARRNGKSYTKEQYEAKYSKKVSLSTKVQLRLIIGGKK